jgi:hypothetical protein
LQQKSQDVPYRFLMEVIAWGEGFLSIKLYTIYMP